MRQGFSRASGVRLAAILVVMFAGHACGQAARIPGTIVIATAGDPTLPVPYVGTGITQNADIADQLFLRFGVLAPASRTTGDDALLPMLARSWKRVDSLTLLFELDPRAHWHDGAPVTAHDVVFTWGLARNPKVNGNQAAIESIASVEETGPRTVRVRFRRAFAEQLYRFAFDFQTLPSHLLEKLRPESIGTSDFASHPVGNGPYKWSRRVPGQLVELVADTTFFAGRPGLGRVMFRVAADPSARLNLLLSGDLDVLDNIPPVSLPQVAAMTGYRVDRIPFNNITYALFNQRSATDTSVSNAVLTDIRVREALTRALDRVTMAGAVFGPGTQVPDAAQSLLWSWVSGGTIRATPPDVARARTLLAAAGWRDTDGDGYLDKSGAPLRLQVIYASSSPTRTAFAVQAQAMWKAIGVQAELHPYLPPDWIGHRNSGQFDVDITGVSQDASPLSLTEAWSCASAQHGGPPNVGHWCDPTFDKLVNSATVARNPVEAWRGVLARMAGQYPAAFLAAPQNVVAVHRRFDNTTLLPVKQWLSLWRWRLRPGAAIARDR